MNHDLIKQLELAIAVEKGEVPLSDVERRLNADYVSTDNSRLVWHTAPGTHTPKHWNFREYEYRRKPKPLECWVNVYGPGGKTVAHTNEEEAKLSAQSACLRVAVHMREVTNE